MWRTRVRPDLKCNLWGRQEHLSLNMLLGEHGRSWWSERTEMKRGAEFEKRIRGRRWSFSVKQWKRLSVCACEHARTNMCTSVKLYFCIWDFSWGVIVCGPSTSVPGCWSTMLHIVAFCRFPSLVCYLKLTAAFNLHRGPVTGSLSVCICAWACVFKALASCRYRKLLHHLAAGFCVPPPQWLQHGGAFYKAALPCLPPPPFQHTANAAHAHSFPLSTCTHTRRPRLTDVPGLCRSSNKYIKRKKCARGVFRSEYNHGYGQTNGKYTGKESTQEAGLLEL